MISISQCSDRGHKITFPIVVQTADQVGGLWREGCQVDEESSRLISVLFWKGTQSRQPRGGPGHGSERTRPDDEGNVPETSSVTPQEAIPNLERCAWWAGTLFCERGPHQPLRGDWQSFHNTANLLWWVMLFHWTEDSWWIGMPLKQQLNSRLTRSHQNLPKRLVDTYLPKWSWLSPSRQLKQIIVPSYWKKRLTGSHRGLSSQKKRIGSFQPRSQKHQSGERLVLDLLGIGVIPSGKAMRLSGQSHVKILDNSLKYFP